MKTYIGKRFSEGCEVYVVEDGKQYPLPLHLEARNHSPTGFEFGYLGSGPAQLAVAILADYCGPVKPPPTVCPYCNSPMSVWKCTAPEDECGYDGNHSPEDKWDNIQNDCVHYQNFKRDVISQLPKEGFELAGDRIDQWLSQQTKQRA